MVCLTTFGDTKRVISQSLIIFHTFYGYVQGRGALSRGSARSPPRSLHTSPPPPQQPVFTLHTARFVTETPPAPPVVYFLWSGADFLISPAQPPAFNCSEGNPVVPRQKAFFCSFSARLRIHFMSNMERGGKNRRRNKGVRAEAPSVVADWLEARASCSQAGQFHIWIQCLWHLFKCFRN